jgi:uncharacterized membrane protein
MDVVILIHVAGGTVGLCSGAVAMIFRKGRPVHRKAGNIFFVSMLVLALSGSLIAMGLTGTGSDRGTVVIGLLTAYLVTTAWGAARRRVGGTGRLELVALAVGVGCALAMFGFGLQAMNSPNGQVDSLPTPVFFAFGSIAALGAALDLNFILRRRAMRAQRIGRHLWRMCTALLIAAASFFLGQQDEFPAAWRGAPIWYLPPLLTLLSMIFWIVRVRFSKAFGRVAPGGGQPAEPDRAAGVAGAR